MRWHIVGTTSVSQTVLSSSTPLRIPGPLMMRREVLELMPHSAVESCEPCVPPKGSLRVKTTSPTFLP